MADRIVVTLSPATSTSVDRLADTLAAAEGMRVGFVIPSLGAVVGEVSGEDRVARIRDLPEVSSVRLQESGRVRRGRH